MDNVEPLPWIHPVNQFAVGCLGAVAATLLFLIPGGTTKQGRNHVIVTGGSSGIGLGLAKECAKLGFSHITLIARNKQRLEAAKKEIEATAPASTKIHAVSLDVTVQEDVEKAAKSIVDACGPPDLLFNNAGNATARPFEDTPTTDFENLMKVNYFGAVFLTQALMPSIKHNGGGTIAFTSSMAGQVGVYGYTAYSPTKFALRGFAESLQMELRRDNISVVLAFPPDTDTPGFKAENETKPKETHLIGASVGLFDPKTVAKTIVEKALQKNPPFCIYFGLEGWMLSTLTAGMSPVHGLVDAFCQVVLGGILRLVALFYLWDFTRIIAGCKEEKDEKPKQE